ncbi:MAG: orotidine-5'-phosphate decarboxylase [Methanocellales archaeon]|nr:orotidine-5'-phosphate decarboxylase [Methanocellales archaeon]
MKFSDKLSTASKKNDSLLCVGLDPDMGKISSFLRSADDPIFEFNKRIIDATKDLVIAYKPNLAFYEALGLGGLKSLVKTMEYIPDDIPVIGDAKRGDVGHSARAYARAMFDVLGFDAVTVNPYLGTDSIAPFLDYEDKGVFVLCRTSNPSAKEFQDVGPKPLYQIVAESVVKWNVHKNCGVVVGATYPDELRKIRELVGEDMWILIPGIGVQGGDLRAAVKSGTNSHGERAIICSSRGILYAGAKDDFDKKAREAALALREQINLFRRD